MSSSLISELTFNYDVWKIGSSHGKGKR